MRASIRRDDPGYDPDARYYDVLLDGVSVSHLCHTADEEKGYVDGYQRDDAGLIMLNPLGIAPIEKRYYGKVQIIKGARSK